MHSKKVTISNRVNRQNIALTGLCLAMVAALMSSSLPSPLYPGYQQQWHLSSFFVNVLFAAYAIGVLAALSVMGLMADRLPDRRIAVVGAMCLTAVSAIMMAFAQGETTFCIGRTLSGLGIGLLLGSASAALLELAAGQDGRIAALQATLSFTLGSGIGPVISGVCLRFKLWQDTAPYLFILVCAITALVCVCAQPLPV